MKIKLPVKRKMLVIPAIALLLLISSLLVAIVFGWDQYFFNTKISGNVNDENGDPVAGARINIQDKISESNAAGEFIITGLRYGLYPLRINKNGYAPFTETVSLGRYDNIFTFSLDPLDFGRVRFVFEVEGDADFMAEGMELKLNKNALKTPEITNDTPFYETQELIVGDYLLEVFSPYFQDISVNFRVEPGQKQEQIRLRPAADLDWQVFDYLSGNELRGAGFQVSGPQGKIDADFIETNGGNYSLRDIVPGEYIIQIDLEGYKPLDLDREVISGVNSLGDLELVREGRMATILGREVIISDYDGENLKRLVLPQRCQELRQDNTTAVIFCDREVIWIDKQQAVIVAQPELPSETIIGTQAVNFNDRLTSFVTDNNLLAIMDHLGNTTELFTSEERLYSTLLSDEFIWFTKAEGVYRLRRSGLLQENLTSGSFSLMDSGSEGELLMRLVSDNLNTSLWLYDGGEKIAITGQSGQYTQGFFCGTERVCFLDGGQQGRLFYYDKTTGSLTRSLEGIVSIYNINGFGMILVNQQDEIYLQQYSNDNFVKVDLTN